MTKWIGAIASMLLLAVLLANCESKKDEKSSASRVSLLALGQGSPAIDLTTYLQRQVDIGDRNFNQVEFKLLPDPLSAQDDFFYNTSVLDCIACNEPFSQLQVQAHNLGTTSLHIGVQKKGHKGNNVIDRVEFKFVVMLGESRTSEGFMLSGPKDLVAGTQAVYHFQSPETENNLTRVVGFLADPALGLCDDDGAKNKNICIEPLQTGSSMQLARHSVEEKTSELKGLGFRLEASDSEVLLFVSVKRKPTTTQGFMVALFDEDEIEAQFNVQSYAGLFELVPQPLAPLNLQAQCQKQVQGAGEEDIKEIDCSQAGSAQSMWAELTWSYPQLASTPNPYAGVSLMYQIERCSKDCADTTVAGPHDVQKQASWLSVARVSGLTFNDRLAYNAQGYHNLQQSAARVKVYAQPGQTYYYRVRALGGLGVVGPTSEASSTVFGKLPPSAPQNLSLKQYQPNPLSSAVLVRPDQIIVQWEGSQHKGGHKFVSYQVEGCVEDCNDEDSWHELTNGATAKALIEGEKVIACSASGHIEKKCNDDLQGDFIKDPTESTKNFVSLTTAGGVGDERRVEKAIFYRIKACGREEAGLKCAGGADFSRPSSLKSIVLYRAPTSPREFVLKHVEDSQTTQLNWKAPEDMGGDLLHYIIEASLTTGEAAWAQLPPTRSTQWQGPRVSNRKYRIRARNAKAFISAPTQSER